MAAMSSLPFEPCDDIVDLYGWHDGTDLERAAGRGNEAWELAPSIYFPPLARVLTSYRDLSELSLRVTPVGGVSRDYWRDDWLPVFQCGAEQFVVSSGATDRGAVWFLTWEQPALMAYDSLADMADRLAVWLESGVFSVDAAGRMTPRFDMLEHEERAYPYFW